MVTTIISWGFSLFEARHDGLLGEVVDYQVEAIANTSIQYAKSSIKTASLATLIEALEIETCREKPRRSLVALIVTAINRSPVMKERGWTTSVTFE